MIRFLGLGISATSRCCYTHIYILLRPGHICLKLLEDVKMENSHSRFPTLPILRAIYVVLSSLFLWWTQFIVHPPMLPYLPICPSLSSLCSLSKIVVHSSKLACTYRERWLDGAWSRTHTGLMDLKQIGLHRDENHPQRVYFSVRKKQMEWADNSLALGYEYIFTSHYEYTRLY